MSTLDLTRPSSQRLLGNGNFTILWLGQLISQLGDAFFNFAMVVWIINTAGAPALAAIMMAASIPGIVLGPVAGTLVDNLNRKSIIILSDMFRGAIMFFAVLIIQQQIFTISHVYGLLIIFGIVRPLFNSAISASLPNIVQTEHLAQANSLRQATQSGTALLGPALAAVMFAAVGGVEKAIIIFFFLNGISYVLSGISEIFLDLPSPVREKAATGKEALANFGRQLVEGLSYIVKSSMLVRMFTVFAAMNFFLAPLVEVVLPALIIEVYCLEEIWLGFIQSGISGGFLLGAFVLTLFKQTRRSKLLVLAIFGLGISIASIGLAAGLPLYTTVSPVIAAGIMVFAAVLIGTTAAVTNISLSTIMQIIVPNEKRGRVFAGLNTLSSGLVPISLGTAGLMALAIPIFVQPLLGGAAVMIASILLKGIKELQEH